MALPLAALLNTGTSYPKLRPDLLSFPWPGFMMLISSQTTQHECELSMYTHETSKPESIPIRLLISAAVTSGFGSETHECYTETGRGDHPGKFALMPLSKFTPHLGFWHYLILYAVSSASHARPMRNTGLSVLGEMSGLTISLDLC